MTVDFAERLGLEPEIRMASFSYREEFGHPPAVIWQVPGRVTLLADGPLRLTVAAPWGAIAVAGHRRDGIIELVREERPGERVRLTVAEATAGAGPAWAGTGLAEARAGAALLVRTELPEGTGLGAAGAIEQAIRLCLGEADAGGQAETDSPPPGGSWPQWSPAEPQALLGSRRLPFDLDAAGLRLMIIDTRVRGAARQTLTEHSPVEAAAAAIGAGDLEALGPLLNAAHKALECDDGQELAVSAALRAGALGARMITDGPGRPVCALLPAHRLAGAHVAIAAEFGRRGLRPPRFLTFTPVGGPRRV